MSALHEPVRLNGRTIGVIAAVALALVIILPALVRWSQPPKDVPVPQPTTYNNSFCENEGFSYKLTHPNATEGDEDIYLRQLGCPTGR